MADSNPLFHITTGDIDGIGLEVTLKALNQLDEHILSSYCFVIWIHSSQVEIVKSSLNHQPCFLKYEDFSANVSSLNTNLVFLCSDLSPAYWFEAASQYCLDKKGVGIITAPLSKQESFSLGHNDLGHTEILKRICQIDLLFMAFIGEYFNVVLYSDHVPVKDVVLDKDKFKYFLDLTFLLNGKFPNYTTVLLGLNPHAGDKGLIGKEDGVISSWIQEWQPKNLIGPVPADSAFCNYKQTPSTYAALYHDQGLIPFKMAHGFTGYHTTLGLPFIRTSVDHGTGKNIFNQNKADFSSMLDAIRGAAKIHQGSMK
ncbi:MAG: 4-hydroxythreonine-4-phosphate dehydrogenase PdxA [Bdellovibrionaceae bacterium]|nr:4-hydroxythreonine-4-phosphate dehydrogenase PdxA [Pseudobdellovibrionaceae bacterium]